MKNRNDLALHLMSEVAHFILESDPRRMIVSVHLEGDGFHLMMMDDLERDEKEIEEINGMLHAAQRPELSGYYGSMTGLESLGQARLNMVGWQIKYGQIIQREGGSRIDLLVGGRDFDPTPFELPGEGC